MRAWVLGEFEGSEALLAATRLLRAEGLRALDTHTPYPVRGLEEALGLPRSGVSTVAFVGGVVGVLTAYLTMVYFNVVEYPLNLANKPPHSPPVFIPVTFEIMVLFSSLAIVTSLVVYFWAFPRLHHPLFEHDAFRSASSHGWWLSVNSEMPDMVMRARERLDALGAKNVTVIHEFTAAPGGHA
ncbi:MAG: DUF3341 domain-containing protein [Myxococcaceae bacterium]|nr:DUF3341 domain-containing protein [Myxococcaceae bacterium]